MKKAVMFIILVSSVIVLAQAPTKNDAQKALESVKTLFPQWQQLSFDLDKITESPIPDYYQARFYVTHEDKSAPVVIYFRKDGKYVFVGQLIDAAIKKSLTREFAGEIKYASVDVNKLDLKNAAHIGDLNAPIKIIEYADFQCPFCKKAAPVIKEIIKNYNKEIVFVYKHIPWPKHEFSQNMALAAECAKDQNESAFWAFHNSFFSEQFKVVELAELNAKLNDIAQKAKLNISKFNDCYNNKKAEAKVKAQADEARAIEVSSTPTFIINGKRILGAQPYDDFKKVIDEKLKEIKQQENQHKENTPQK